ncbi:cytochrome b [Colwellia sp. D2M02]|uniref:cytochrome b n=1 Tax=Colwellia sp. D2M02 TaxID=2841562 RepID=UPI001C098A69|nr:cytochrome b [Colwellia sp. D2M02]MBU2894205.1 cytochrome b [Colwellia sp. D2M02]
MATSNIAITRTFHWVMAFVIIAITLVGLYMANTETYALYHWHKSFGLIALLLIIARLFWRKKHVWESASKGTSQAKLVNFVHLFLLALLMLMPLSGMVYSGFAGYGFSLFEWHIIPKNLNSEQQVIPYNELLGSLGKTLHGLLGYLFAGVVVLHVGAALKHHFINKDQTLNRMLNKKPSENT